MLTRRDLCGRSRNARRAARGAGAKANWFAGASALRQRGHELALLHGAPTGRDEEAWREVFPRRFSAGGATAALIALQEFQPAVVFLHNSPGLALTAGLAAGN